MRLDELGLDEAKHEFSEKMLWKPGMDQSILIVGTELPLLLVLVELIELHSFGEIIRRVVEI